MKEQQKTESINFQKEMYAWMLKRKMQGKISQEIQEIETTNAKLKKAGYPETPLTTAELCTTLGVGGIMTSNYSLTKPMSEGAAIAAAVLVGVWGTTNRYFIQTTSLSWKQGSVQKKSFFARLLSEAKNSEYLVQLGF
jgi:hypothetical protein